MNTIYCSDRLFQCHSANSPLLHLFSATVTHSISTYIHHPQNSFNIYPYIVTTFISFFRELLDVNSVRFTFTYMIYTSCKL